MFNRTTVAKSIVISVCTLAIALLTNGYGRVNSTWAGVGPTIHDKFLSHPVRCGFPACPSGSPPAPVTRSDSRLRRKVHTLFQGRNVLHGSILFGWTTERQMLPTWIKRPHRTMLSRLIIITARGRHA